MPENAASAPNQVTPAMRQYLDAKRQHPDAILFFRMGDFYEMFYEDALVASRALELTLTSRAKDAAGGAIPMCGVPYHAADAYLARLVKKGFRVAICDQVEDPRHAKGIVRREVVRVVSPGTFTDGAYLEARESVFLMALVSGPPADPHIGVALLELSTGEFSASEFSGPGAANDLAEELLVLRPREIVVPSDLDEAALVPEPARAGVTITRVEPWMFGYELARRALVEQLCVGTLDGFGLTDAPLAVRAAGALVQHLRQTQKVDLSHLKSLSYRRRADGLVLDATTLRHLEVLRGADGSEGRSLVSILDRTITAMGGRLIRGWLRRPLISIERIADRLDAVEELLARGVDRGRLRTRLADIHDVERLVARAVMGQAGPRDLSALRQSLAAVPSIRETIASCQAPLLVSLRAQLDDHSDLRLRLESMLIENPPVLARDGGFVRDGVDEEIDRLRRISRSGKQVIAEMEARERQRTGIASLKIRFNKVFGYYIEVSKANLRAVPPDYHRKQTIAGGERFITPDLKAYEEQVLGADERVVERELELFEELRRGVAERAPLLQGTARALATLDALAGFAEAAALSNYTRPRLHDGDELAIMEGRHPVVERVSEEPFVPNDVALNGSDAQLVVLTGPNMGGKSTYLRQTALICLMAQAGSFVPAREARLPIVDRIFARVGASDNIASGQSTFMVEMQETASILRAASSRSLVILDEVGRGTATFDGLSLAWAVAEYLVTNPRARPKTLFATHYHELTALADLAAGVVNAHVTAREWRDDIVFLRKVVPGRSDRSYGIQVARLAGMPPPIIARARELLAGLERDALIRSGRPALSVSPGPASPQLGLFGGHAAEEPPVVRTLRALDLDRMTPLQALATLAELKKEVEGQQ